MINFYKKIIAKLNIYLLSPIINISPIPKNPKVEFNIEDNQKILYLMPVKSYFELLILKREALKVGLKNPLLKNTIDNQDISSYIFLDDKKSSSKEIFQKYLKYCLNGSEDILIVTTSILWNRAPGYDNKKLTRIYKNSIKKFISIVLHGRTSSIKFSKPISLKELIKKDKLNSYNDLELEKLLKRAGEILIHKENKAITGAKLPYRKSLIKNILDSENVLNIIQQLNKSKKATKIKYKETSKIFINPKKEAKQIINEMASNMNYTGLRLSDKIFKIIWTKLYKGINVLGAKKLREISSKGENIVYIASHRSHLDYLLLSYVLHHEGLALPHIAAGVNLNFKGGGAILRRGGAFFIRRNFQGNRLYSSIFKEYISNLFLRGNPIEFFIEGGRSRTGKLLNPKTGVLSVLLSAAENNNIPITIVPVYIGYERTVEVGSYHAEIKGAKKEKESIFLMLKALKTFRNFGECYLNFGEPINIDYSKIESFNKKDTLNIANKIMFNINSAASLNSISLICSSLLMNSGSLEKAKLAKHINTLIELINNTKYSKTINTPKKSPKEIIEHSLTVKYLGIQLNSNNKIYLDEVGLYSSIYYFNNIRHVFILPSLIALYILKHSSINIDKFLLDTKELINFISDNYFIDINPSNNLKLIIKNTLDYFLKAGYIYKKHQYYYRNFKDTNLKDISILSYDIFLKYYFILFIEITKTAINSSSLENILNKIQDSNNILYQINMKNARKEILDELKRNKSLDLFKLRNNLIKILKSKDIIFIHKSLL
ncbi:MAG: 1-acyl-sn-glycerol-3-phosphate acyltransferase [Psittacicella sp.]